MRGLQKHLNLTNFMCAVTMMVIGWLHMSTRDLIASQADELAKLKDRTAVVELVPENTSAIKAIERDLRHMATREDLNGLKSDLISEIKELRKLVIERR